MRTLVALSIFFSLITAEAHQGRPRGKNHPHNHNHQHRDCRDTFVARSQSDLADYESLRLQTGVDRKLHINTDINSTDLRIETDCEIKIHAHKKLNVTGVLLLFAEKIDFGNKVEITSKDFYVKTDKKIKLDDHLEITTQRMYIESSEEIKFKNKSILVTDVGIFNAPDCDVKPRATRLVTQELGTCFNKAPFLVDLLVSPLSGDAPLNVNFDASKSFGLVDSFVYHFGTGDKLETLNEGAAYIYVTPGSFSARLEAKGSFGSLFSSVQTILVNPPVVTDFQIFHDIVRINPPAVIYSTGEVPALENLKEFLWDFGDNSSIAVPFTFSQVGFAYHDYATEADYTVKLRLKDQANLVTAPVEKVVSTFADALPVPRYAINTFKGEAPLTVDVQALEATDAYGEPMRFQWFFTDTMETIALGSTRQVQHTFTLPGIYQIQLGLTDSRGAVRSVLIPIYVGQSNALTSLPPFPVVDSTERYGESPLTVNFTAVGSFDPDGVPGQPLTYQWTFFDNGRNQNVSFFGQNFSYTFIKPAVAQVRLIVTDVTGQQGSTVVPIYVSGPVSTPGGFVVAAGAGPRTYNFNINPFMIENTYSYESILWDFGDGTQSRFPTTAHVFPSVGDYPVTLKIRKIDGDFETYTQVVRVAEVPVAQTASISTNGNRYNLNEPKTFTALTNIPQDAITAKFTWHFGDGTSVSGIGSGFSSVSHIYSNPGQYRVTLHTQFASGLANYAQFVMTPNAAPTLGEVKIYRLPAIAPALVGFAPVETAVDTDGFVQTYVYEFGDGSAPVITSQGYVEHTFNVAGNYAVTITAIDNNGGRASRTFDFAVLSNQIPIARIVVYPQTSLIAPARIGFAGFDQSSDGDGFLTQYEYDFGDGATLTTQEGYVEHEYPNAGTYRLGLRVRDDKGLWSEKAFYDLIIAANQIPIARMSVDVIDVTAPGLANIEVWRTSTDSDGFIAQYEYDFGDGTALTDSDGYEQHSYAQAGSYTIKVRVQDDRGAWSLPIEQTISILQSQKPIAINTIYSGEFYAPATVYMNAHVASYDLDGIITQIEYVFGDGTNLLVPSSEAFVGHEYLLPGNYIVQARVMDGDGVWSDYVSNSVEIKQSVAPVVGDVPIYGDMNKPAPAMLGFSPGEVTTSSHHPLNYIFDFGDGAIVDNGNNGYLEHTYQNSGTYTVLVTVRDSRNQTTAKSLQVTIKENQPPSLLGLNIFGNFNEPAPLAVRFDMFGQIVEEYGQVASILYEFGDGNSSTSFAQVEHVYEAPGTYLVVVTVTDDQGAIARISRQITINSNQPPVALALKVYKGDSPLAPVTVGVAAYESFQDLDGFIASYIYDFGDGRVEETANGYLEHVYTTPGNFTLRVSALDNKGAMISSEVSIFVRTNNPPVAAFELAKMEVEAYEVFSLDAGALSSDPDGDALIYSWSFGDGTESSFSMPSHYYSAPGDYTISLSARDSLGGSSQTSKTIRVLGAEDSLPIAEFSVTQGVDGSVSLDASGSFVAGGQISKYIWSYGDGESVEGGFFNYYSYSEPGSYQITLTVESEAGKRQSKTKTVSWLQFLPNPDYDFSPIQISSSGFSELTFNPKSLTAQFTLSEVTAFAEPLNLTVNGKTVSISTLAEGISYEAGLILQDGQNHLILFGRDGQNRILRKEWYVVAGTRQLTLAVVDEQSNPMPGSVARIEYRFTDSDESKRSVKLQGVANSMGQVTINNAPEAGLLVYAKGLAQEFGAALVGEYLTSYDLRIRPFGQASPLDNNFSDGATGWQIRGSSQIQPDANGINQLLVRPIDGELEARRVTQSNAESLSFLANQSLRNFASNDEFIAYARAENEEWPQILAGKVSDYLIEAESELNLPELTAGAAGGKVELFYYLKTNTGAQSTNIFTRLWSAYAQTLPLVTFVIESPSLGNIAGDFLLGDYHRFILDDDQDRVGSAVPTSDEFSQLVGLGIGPDFDCQDSRQRVLPIGGGATGIGEKCASFLYLNPSAVPNWLKPNDEVFVVGLQVIQGNVIRQFISPTVPSLKRSVAINSNAQLGKRPLFILNSPGTLTANGGKIRLRLVMTFDPALALINPGNECTDGYECFNVGTNLIPLINYRDPRRYDPAKKDILLYNRLYGGDHWMKPIMKSFLDNLPVDLGFTIGDVSNGNGGKFNPHNGGHRYGQNVDIKTIKHSGGENEDTYAKISELRHIFREVPQSTNIYSVRVGLNNPIYEAYVSNRCFNGQRGNKVVNEKSGTLLIELPDDHRTHWHLELKDNPSPRVETYLGETLRFIGYEDDEVSAFISFEIIDGISRDGLLFDLIRNPETLHETLLATSDVFVGPNTSLNVAGYSFSFNNDQTIVRLQVPKQELEDLQRYAELRVTFTSGNGCREAFVPLPIEGCADSETGETELGYYYRNGGGFISGLAEIDPAANFYAFEGTSVCGRSKIQGSVGLYSSGIRVTDSELIGEANRSVSISGQTLVRNARIAGSVDVNATSIIDGGPASPAGKGVIIDSLNLEIDVHAQVLGPNTQITGQASIGSNSTVVSSRFEGGLVASAPLFYLRTAGEVRNATARGYGYINGRLLDGAVFDGSYLAYSNTSGPFTVISQSGIVTGQGTYMSGFLWNQGTMIDGCRANNVSVGSVINPGAGCGSGASLNGYSIILNGFMTGISLFNQTFDNGVVTP